MEARLNWDKTGGWGILKIPLKIQAKNNQGLNKSKGGVHQKGYLRVESTRPMIVAEDERYLRSRACVKEWRIISKFQKSPILVFLPRNIVYSALATQRWSMKLLEALTLPQSTLELQFIGLLCRASGGKVQESCSPADSHASWNLRSTVARD